MRAPARRSGLVVAKWHRNHISGCLRDVSCVLNPAPSRAVPTLVACHAKKAASQHTVVKWSIAGRCMTFRRTRTQHDAASHHHTNGRTTVGMHCAAFCCRWPQSTHKAGLLQPSTLVKGQQHGGCWAHACRVMRAAVRGCAGGDMQRAAHTGEPKRGSQCVFYQAQSRASAAKCALPIPSRVDVT